MPSAPLIYTSGAAAAQAITTTAEIVVATVTGVTTRYAGQTIKLWGMAFITSGSTTTACIVQIRRSTLTGTQVGDHTGQSVITAAAGSNIYPVYATDSPGDVANMSYVLTVTDTGGGTGGTTVYAVLEARVD